MRVIIWFDIKECKETGEEKRNCYVDILLLCVYCCCCYVNVTQNHKNSIFCLSKLIKSNEWDFLIRQRWNFLSFLFLRTFSLLLIMFRNIQHPISFSSLSALYLFLSWFLFRWIMARIDSIWWGMIRNFSSSTLHSDNRLHFHSFALAFGCVFVSYTLYRIGMGIFDSFFAIM